MDGLTRWLAAPFETKLSGEQLLLAPLRLSDFAVLECEAAGEVGTVGHGAHDFAGLAPAEMARWLCGAAGIVATLRWAVSRTMPDLAVGEIRHLARRASVAELTRVLTLLDRATGLVLGNVLRTPWARGPTSRGAAWAGRVSSAS
jgi:hypothetical protein